MEVRDFFAADSGDARQVRAAAATAGFALGEHPHPARGPAGEAPLPWMRRGSAPRSARPAPLGDLRDPRGRRTSAAPAAVGPGSLQTRELERLPADTAALLIHAVNPYGFFAWLRRVDEDNVNLDRNFLRHGGAYPENPGYRELREAICPRESTAESRAATDAVLEAYAARHGAWRFQSAYGGNTSIPGALLGGTAPVWSHRTLLAILAAEGASVRHVGAIDLHTGLGPYGVGEIINLHHSGEPDASASSTRSAARQRPSKAAPPARRKSAATRAAASHSRSPTRVVAAVGLEYGTRRSRRCSTACARTIRFTSTASSTPRKAGGSRARSAPPSMRTRTIGRPSSSRVRST